MIKNNLRDDVRYIVTYRNGRHIAIMGNNLKAVYRDGYGDDIIEVNEYDNRPDLVAEIERIRNGG